MGSLVAGAVLVAASACATSVDDGSDGPGVFAADDDAGAATGDAATSTPKKDAGRDAAPVAHDATATVDAGTLQPEDDTGTPPPVTVDAATTIDATSPPPPPPPVGSVCASSNGLYTIEYLALISGDGGVLQPCPCGAGDCCYTPPGGFIPAVCLKK